MLANVIHIRRVSGDLWMGTGTKGDTAAETVVSSNPTHMRPDESKQVLLQLHFEFRWIVGFLFCTPSMSYVFPRHLRLWETGKTLARRLHIYWWVYYIVNDVAPTVWEAPAKCEQHGLNGLCNNEIQLSVRCVKHAQRLAKTSRYKHLIKSPRI